MRAISVYSGRMVIYNGGEADVRLRGMNVPRCRLQIYGEPVATPKLANIVPPRA